MFAPSRTLRSSLQRAPAPAFVAYASVVAFATYFCMYAFRKPFAAATFEGQSLWGMDLKMAMVIGQVVGYALSKFLSIKYVSEVSRGARARTLVVLIVAAELALLGVGLSPAPGKVLFMFLNGVPLGAVWGLVFSFLEGRRTSEILGAGLSMSYIVASGAVKAVGKWLLALGVPDGWMPSMVGLMFLPAFVLLVWLLACLPAPSEADEQARSAREPMSGEARRGFFRSYAPGLLSLTVLYVLLTAYRDFRDNFAVELWADLGHGETPSILALAELPVAAFTMVALALVFAVRDNRTAFFVVHGIMIVGALTIGTSTWLFEQGSISGEAWMVAVGSGLYLGYVPFGCVLFDRLMAMTRSVGTSVFMIYVTDASGYAGSVALILFKEFASPGGQWLQFFRMLSHITALVCLVGFVASGYYFASRTAVDAERRSKK